MAEAQAAISKGMLTAELLEVLVPGLAPAVETPVGGPSPWSIACNVTLPSDSRMVSAGNQQWKLDGAPAVLENLSRYPSGVAAQALVEGAEAAQQCTSFSMAGLEGDVEVLGPVEVTDGVLVVCLRPGTRSFCSRARARGDYISQIGAFGSTEKEARDLMNLIAGVADAQLDAAGL